MGSACYLNPKGEGSNPSSDNLFLSKDFLEHVFFVHLILYQVFESTFDDNIQYSSTA